MTEKNEAFKPIPGNLVFVKKQKEVVLIEFDYGDGRYGASSSTGDWVLSPGSFRKPTIEELKIYKKSFAYNEDEDNKNEDLILNDVPQEKNMSKKWLGCLGYVITILILAYLVFGFGCIFFKIGAGSPSTRPSSNSSSKTNISDSPTSNTNIMGDIVRRSIPDFLRSETNFK